jgi:antitoxin component YwqK of YwqJK toxin-antitoxin module
MTRIVLLAALLMIASIGYSQEKVEQKYNKETNLVEATYYYDNGNISQEGTFNTKGKLHGEWTSYNEEGKKIAMGTYENGVRTGTWYFWADGTLKEVEFNDNQIASITEQKNTSGIVKQ